MNGKLFLIVVINFVLFTAALNAQTIYDSYSGFTVPSDPVLPAAEVHPSLWFNSSQITELKNKKNINTYLTNSWNGIQADIKKYNSKTASSQSINERPRMAKILAFAWIMSGDTTARRKSIEALLTAYDNVPRTETANDFDNDYDEIYRATWLQNYCEAYDWVFSELTPGQNSLIRKKITDEVILL